MLALNLASRTAEPRTPWPADAIFGVDLINRRAMRLGQGIPMADAMTFSRASPRLARTSAGLWQSFAVDVPAITDLGLSLEAAATNLIVNNTGNSGPGILLTGTTLAPIGGNDSPARDAHGKRVTQGGGATDGLTRHTLDVVGGQTYSWSQSFKYDGSATWIRFTFSDNVAHGINVWLNLQTMTVGQTGVFGSAVLASCTLVPEVDGWARLHMTGTVPNNAVGGLSTYVSAGNGNTTRTSGSYGIWGTQMAVGPHSSPILSGQMTRASDLVNLQLPSGPQVLSLRLSTGSVNTWAVAGTNEILAPSQDIAVAVWTE